MTLWTCPDCGWSQSAHPRYGWQRHDDRAVEVHRTALCPARRPRPVPVRRLRSDVWPSP